MIATVLGVVVGALMVGALAYHLGRLKGAEEERDRRARGGDEEVTGVQCARCLRDVRECSCRAAARGRA